ncbi:MAG TPA: pilus assembly PilX N-terminal domain-containing protein [Parcubacteria group bacterium]|nr:pilus assembly PilX N-terminal domain-containing protein [Parcubacteria group bacterium]
MKNRGFTLFIAIVISATLLLVSSGIISVAVKEAFLTTANRHSQEAFYAADTGIECALYWDLKNPGGLSAFATSTTAVISCNGQSFTVGGSSGQSNFTLTFLPDLYCTEVRVTRRRAQPSLNIKSTTIESYGYNTCDPTNPRRVQRAIGVSY